MKYIILPFILILTTIVLLGCTEQLPPEEGFEDDQVIAGQAVSGGGGIIGEKVDNCKKESDGNSIFYQGTLTYSNKGKEYGPYTDKCYKNKLLEYSCTNNKVARKWVNCPEGGECKDGACIGPCTDTDEGKNFQEKGTVKGWSTLGQLGSKTDFCINKTTEGFAPGDLGKLWEFSCNSQGVITADTFDCTKEEQLCLNGACVNEKDLLCSPNTYFCVNEISVARCTADGTDFTPIVDCDDGEVCKKGECVNYDLSYYPGMFIKDGQFNGYLIIGTNAPALDNLALTEIAASLKYKNAVGEMVVVEIGNSAMKLDSEVSDPETKNLIVIGSPCVNSISAQLLGNPTECWGELTQKQAKIKLIAQKSDNYALLIEGYAGEEDLLAAKWLAKNYNNLEGTEILLEGTSMEDLSVTVLQQVIIFLFQSWV